jgi:hypothetical protein
MRSVPGMRRFGIWRNSYRQATSPPTIEGGRSPTVHLAGGRCCTHTPAGTAAPGPSLRAPALATPRHPQSARWRCHIPVALSLYGRSEPSLLLVATQGRAWGSQPLGQPGIAENDPL